MMKPRIAMLLDNPFRPDLRVLREAEALTEWGHEVTIYAWDRDIGVERPARERLKDIEIIRIPAKSEQQLGLRQIPYYLMYVWRVFWLVMQGECEVVHCHDLPNLPIGVLLKLLKRVHLVYDAHELYWIMEARRYRQFILYLIKYGEILLLRFVDAFITVGVRRAEYYKKYYKETIHIVGNWYDRRLPDKRLGEDLRKRLGIPEDAFVVTHAGRLCLERGADVLIDSAQRLRNKTRIHWFVCGRGPAELAFRQAASQIPNLHFFGWVEDMTPFYSATNAVIYLMDSSYPYTAYNSPNNLYLSIAWTLPLIAVAAGEIEMVLTSGETGLLIDKMDVGTVCSTVRRLSEQPDLHERIAKNLEELQDTYSWESAAKSLLSVYSSLD